MFDLLIDVYESVSHGTKRKDDFTRTGVLGNSLLIISQFFSILSVSP